MNKDRWKITLPYISFIIPLAIYVNRLLLPDRSYDSTNYHVVAGRYGWEKLTLPFGSPEFFPLGLHTFSPLLDIPGYILVQLLGYRFGNIFSLFSVLLVSILSLKYLRQVWTGNIPSTRITTLLLFFVLTTREMLFQIGTYFVDNLSSALVIVLIFSATKYLGTKSLRYFWLFCFLAGQLFIAKMSNAIYIIPAGLLLVALTHQELLKRKISSAGAVLVSLIAASPLPVFLFWLTGNPVAPYYNGVFQSPFFTTESFRHFYGPLNLGERLAYPLVSLLNPTRLGETYDLYADHRMTIVLILVIILTAFIWRRGLLRHLSMTQQYLLGLFYSSYVLWVVVFGYMRFASVLEVLGFINLFWLGGMVWQRGRALWLRPAVYSALGLMIFISLVTLVFNARYEMSWRTPLWKNPKAHLEQMPHLMERTLSLSTEQKKQIKDADAFLNCSAPSAGLYALLPLERNKPILLGPMQLSRAIVTEAYYQRAWERLGKTPPINVVALTTIAGADESHSACLQGMKEFGYTIESVSEIDNFLGDERVKLGVITATITQSPSTPSSPHPTPYPQSFP